MERRPADLRQIVGANVRRLREASGKTQEDLADEVGVSPVYLSRIETAKANCSLEVLDALARGLGVGPGRLVGSRKGR